MLEIYIEGTTEPSFYSINTQTQILTLSISEICDISYIDSYNITYKYFKENEDSYFYKNSIILEILPADCTLIEDIIPELTYVALT